MLRLQLTARGMSHGCAAVAPRTCRLIHMRLSHLSFETGGVSPVESPEAIVAVGEEVDPSLRTHLERCFGVPVHQAYGLNEIGRVAVPVHLRSLSRSR